jgi:hypothetical protein
MADVRRERTAVCVQRIVQAVVQMGSVIQNMAKITETVLSTAELNSQFMLLMH